MNKATNYQIEINEILTKNGINITPKYVYHYTDGNALKSIIENQELWLSERNYMNDVLDEKYINSLVGKIIYNKTLFVEPIIEDNFLKQDPQYVFSTSSENDLIHQWAYYGKNDSYCIEFDTIELVKYIAKYSFPGDYHFYGNVIYDKDIASQIIEKIVLTLKAAIKENLVENPSIDEEVMYSFSKQMYQYFYYCIKQFGNYCEKEYRLLIQTNRKPCFKVKNGLFIPYIKVGDINTRIPINRIILGPNNHESISKKSLEKFLTINNYEIEVVESELLTR